jgi:hypothetical protein
MGKLPARKDRFVDFIVDLTFYEIVVSSFLPFDSVRSA